MLRAYQTQIFTGPDADQKRRTVRRERVFPPASERTDLSDLVETIQATGLPKVPDNLSNENLLRLARDTRGDDRISHPQSEVFWDELKNERNALVAIILEKFWGMFHINASEILTTAIEKYNPRNDAYPKVPDLSSIFERMLFNYIFAEKTRDIKGQKKSMKQCIKRLEAITDFGFAYKRWFGGPGAVQHFILRGFNTGKAFFNSLMMIGVTQLIDHKIPCTKENLAKFVKANMRHVTMSASTNIEHGPTMATIFDQEAVALMKSLRCDGNSLLEYTRLPKSTLKAFTFDKETFALTPKQELYEHVAEYSEFGISPAIGDTLPRGGTTGCPARYVRFLFKHLSELYVDMTAQLLAKKFKSNRDKIVALRILFEGI